MLEMKNRSRNGVNFNLRPPDSHSWPTDFLISFIFLSGNPLGCNWVWWRPQSESEVHWCSQTLDLFLKTACVFDTYRILKMYLRYLMWCVISWRGLPDAGCSTLCKKTTYGRCSFDTTQKYISSCTALNDHPEFNVEQENRKPQWAFFLVFRPHHCIYCVQTVEHFYGRANVRCYSVFPFYGIKVCIGILSPR